MATAELPQAPPINIYIYVNMATAELSQAPPMNKDTAELFQVAQDQPTRNCLDVSSTPTLKDVFQLVVAHVAAEWESLAICLGMKACIIDIISRNYSSDCERACNNMLQRWLAIDNHTGEKERTWSTLLTALKEAGFVYLVQDLRKECFI